jgi:hypothetical protein
MLFFHFCYEQPTLKELSQINYRLFDFHFCTDRLKVGSDLMKKEK